MKNYVGFTIQKNSWYRVISVFRVKKNQLYYLLDVKIDLRGYRGYESAVMDALAKNGNEISKKYQGKTYLTTKQDNFRIEIFQL